MPHLACFVADDQQLRDSELCNCLTASECHCATVCNSHWLCDTAVHTLLYYSVDARVPLAVGMRNSESFMQRKCCQNQLLGLGETAWPPHFKKFSARQAVLRSTC